MNHPGIWFSILLLLFTAALPGVVRWKNQSDVVFAGGYVCPPCGCPGHEVEYDLPGTCQSCGMPLIRKDHPSIKIIDRYFRSEHQFDIYHHKLFYPAYFLAIFLGMISLWNYRKNPAMVWFLLFFLSHVSYSFKSQLSGTSHSMHAPERWFYFPGSFLLVTGPALYLYAKQYHQKSWSVNRSIFLHFLPAMLVVVLHAVFFFGAEFWRHNGQYNGFDHYPGLAEQLVFLVSGLYYLLLSTPIIRKQKTLGKPVRNWFYGLFGTQAVLLLIWLLLLSANFYFYNWMATGLDYHLIWLWVALLSLAGAYAVIFQRELISSKTTSRESRIAPEALPGLKERLDHLMDTQKPYLDPELNLQQLADLLDLKEKELSELLNAGLNTSFYAYVNSYRLEAVKTMLVDPQKQHLTNFGIAQEAGFSSRSTFFNLFKKQVGITPGAFKKAHP